MERGQIYCLTRQGFQKGRNHRSPFETYWAFGKCILLKLHVHPSPCESHGCRKFCALSEPGFTQPSNKECCETSFIKNYPREKLAVCHAQRVTGTRGDLFVVLCDNHYCGWAHDNTNACPTYHAVAKTIDLTDSKLGTNEDHSFEVGILRAKQDLLTVLLVGRRKWRLLLAWS